MNLQELIQLQVLKQKAVHAGRTQMADHLMAMGQGDMPLRQMCAKVSVELYQDLENTCSALDITKREFIEAAVSDAIDQAKSAIEKSGGLKALFGADDQGRL